SIQESGRVNENGRLGAPGILDHYDFPMLDNLTFAMIKAIARFSPDFGTTTNLFFLLTFVVTTCTGVYAMRQLGASEGVALTFGVLYAFQPYHFFRGQVHLWLASYYALPLMMPVLVRLASGEPSLLGAGRASASERPRR